MVEGEAEAEDRGDREGEVSMLDFAEKRDKEEEFQSFITPLTWKKSVVLLYCVKLAFFYGCADVCQSAVQDSGIRAEMRSTQTSQGNSATTDHHHLIEVMMFEA
ncbi:hypothetical protein ACH5RR_015334 [Cinchona calisaya]|uniref:Uncharacterized protein n=1 Tax=Cinchona calisaya TaxID=153742 RepID=A0ABD2ZSV0_9GENT